ncbi:MAG: hypothetical protein FWD83_08180, partial [Promicromonosporaceae bacterium]|nr:hypothetical protein [Promicromonosporaceae bacterium]
MEPTTDVLLAAQNDKHLLRNRIRTGEIERVTRGTYLECSALSSDVFAAKRERHLAMLHGVHHQLRTEHAFCLESAAALWGLNTWQLPTVAHVLQSYNAGGRSAPDVRRHKGSFTGVAEVGGLPVTNIERTVADCLL